MATLSKVIDKSPATANRADKRTFLDSLGLQFEMKLRTSFIYQRVNHIDVNQLAVLKNGEKCSQIG